MKCLTMCQGGNSRSVAMAYVLKYKYGLDALACSWEKNSAKTIEALCQWADRIFVMQPQFSEFIPREHHIKLLIIDVGEDRWFNGLHPELVELCDKLFKEKVA